MTRRAQPLSAGQWRLLLELFHAELRAAAERRDPASADDVDDSIDDPGHTDGG